MTRKAAAIFWLTVAISCLAAATERGTASYTVTSTGDTMPRWDEANHRILSYQSQTSVEQVGVQITSMSALEPPVKISVLKDFPGAVQAIPVGVASGPNQSVVVACRIVYPKHPQASALKELILTYDSTGRLTKVWDVAPYEPSAISSDEGGNVYSFGVRFDAHPPADYGTVVEYSADGKIVREMLPGSLFPAGVDPTEWSAETGPRCLSVSRDRIYVYAARVSEVFVLDRSGSILNRYVIRSFFRSLAARNHYAASALIDVSFDGDGNLLFDAGLSEPTIKGMPNSARVGGKLDPSSLQSSEWFFAGGAAGKGTAVARRMIGVTADGSVVWQVRAGGEFRVEITGR